MTSHELALELQEQARLAVIQVEILRAQVAIAQTNIFEPGNLGRVQVVLSPTYPGWKPADVTNATQLLQVALARQGLQVTLPPPQQTRQGDVLTLEWDLGGPNQGNDPWADVRATLEGGYYEANRHTAGLGKGSVLAIRTGPTLPPDE